MVGLALIIVVSGSWSGEGEVIPVYPDKPVLRGVGFLQVGELEAAVAGQRAARAVVPRRTAAAVESTHTFHNEIKIALNINI